MELLNTLYVTTENAYLHLDHEAVRVDVERHTTMRIPLLHLEAIVCFGNVLVSPALIHCCGEEGRSIIFLSRSGRFRARLVGPTGGNVLLRRAQHLAVEHDNRAAGIARSVVAGKVQNGRQLLLRSARETRDASDEASLRGAAQELADVLQRLKSTLDIDRIRGLEGDAARAYFGCFQAMIRPWADGLRFEVRTRRPPRDPLNAVLSFLYALVLSECVAAIEAVGLDPQVGYLHALRPGKPSLALDLMEEFRPVVADRLALALVNRRQLTAGDFAAGAGGAVMLGEEGRRTVLGAYQKRKAESVQHPLLGRSVPLGLVPHAQARLLARHLRGDIAQYCPYVFR